LARAAKGEEKCRIGRGDDIPPTSRKVVDKSKSPRL
jgi:hypothetical protein